MSPFVYYGGKKGSAHRYPPPAFGTIIEPFAGSAGYALCWARPSTRVILVEKDPEVVLMWRRLQSCSPHELAAIECPPVGERCDDPLVMACGGHPDRRQVTTRIAKVWPLSRARLISALPMIRDWEVIEGDYSEAPDVRASWFIDPPYAPRVDGRDPGSGYGEGSAGIDYPALGEWCRERRGQVIVCEQEGADWLPFRPLYRQAVGTPGVGDHPPRVEVVWSRTPGRVQPGTPGNARGQEQRVTKRRARWAR